MKGIMKKAVFLAAAGMTALALSGCSAGSSGKRIVRISHAQSETHPEHLGLLAFKEYVEERLGDKYEVQIFPNELLGSAQKAIELTQTGAIDFVVAGTANLETFAGVYEIFSMPYLFDSEEVYKSVMEDSEYMENVYESTDEAGFRVVTWYNAGTRNFYAKTPIYTPEDLAGKKIRVQQSPASVAMANAFGAAAAPMGFGEVYTAIQQGVIDGAENNELALTNNKHGEVAKYYIENIENPAIILPIVKDWNAHVFHLFTIRCADRDGLQQYLAENDIQTNIHYPIPPHKQECYKEWNDLSFPITELIHAEELSIPMSPVISMEEVERVVKVLNAWK